MFIIKATGVLFVLAIFSVAAAGQYVFNGDFEAGFVNDDNDRLPIGWSRFETSTNEISVIDDVADNGPAAPGADAAHFNRPSGGASGDWTTIEQDICVPVTAETTQLDLVLDVKVISHNLSGGGCCEFEWPATVLIRYRDTAGTARSFQYGFYVSPPGTGAPSPNETLVAAGVYSTQTIDLLSFLTNPQTLTRIRVGGSGWSFESQIDNVDIVANTPDEFPGTGEDVRLESSLGGGAFADGLMCADPGDFVVMRVDSPGGTFDGGLLTILGEVFATGSPPSPVLPGIAVSGGPGTVLVAGGPVAGVGSPLLLNPQGYYVAYAWPNVPGLSFMAQALISSGSAANGIYATSDGQEIRTR